MDWQAFALSLRLATVTTIILLAIAVPLSALLVLGRGRWLAALEALATLPMVSAAHRAWLSFFSSCSVPAPSSGAASLPCSATHSPFPSMASSSAR